MIHTEYTDAEYLLEKTKESDAILIGAASGFSAADGHHFWYEDDREFRDVFGKLTKCFDYHSAFDGLYYPYQNRKQYWAFIATLVHHLYQTEAGQVYKDLKTLIGGKPYHIMTTNQDFLFFQDFPEDRISVIQGDWRYFQRRDGGRVDSVWKNRDWIEKMYDSIKDGQTEIPEDLIPRDPADGMELMPWVRHPGFLKKSMYEEQYAKIRHFLDHWKNRKILFLELG